MNTKVLANAEVYLRRLTCACLVVFACAALGRAQTYRDAPVLISETVSTRALAVNPFNWRPNRLPLETQSLWPAGDETRITMFVTNLDLMPGEGANAFRADAQNLAGHRFSFPIESLHPMPGLDWIYAVTMRLNPELGDSGDVLVRLNWRGMASNRVRL